MPSFNMDDYIPVAVRLNQAVSDIQQIITEPPAMLTGVMGFIRVTIGLKDGRSATATASFRLDLTNRSAAASFPLEDAETSAIGRALGFLGYSSSRGIASREEMLEAERRQTAPTTPQAPPQATKAADVMRAAPNHPTNGSGAMGELRNELARLRTLAANAKPKVIFNPPKSPADMSDLELRAAIDQLTQALEAVPIA